jgi:hypothetical protein
MKPSRAAGRCTCSHDRRPLEWIIDTKKGLEKYWNLVEDIASRHFTDLFVITLLSLGAATDMVFVCDFHRQLKQSP